MVKPTLPKAHDHPVEWRTASPLWDQALQDGSAMDRFLQPALLRFASDEFMSDLASVLADSPGDLAQYVARYETHATEGAGWQPLADKQQQSQALKLFQPAHLRFYLVTAALVCRVPGLPDRKLDAACKEKAAYVLRRLVAAQGHEKVNPKDPHSYDEYAWDATGWRLVASKAVLDSEERLPLFAMQFQENGRPRRLLAGLVPVASQQTYQTKGLSQVAPIQPHSAEDPRPNAFVTKVVQPLRDLAKFASSADATLLKSLQESSTFVLADCASFLQQELPSIWAAIQTDPNHPPHSSITKDGALALNAAWQQVGKILAGEITLGYDLSSSKYFSVESLATWVASQLALATTPLKTPASVENWRAPKLGQGDDYYLIRCVYERPCCKDLHPPLLSAPTEPFQLAPFFDPDAPTRPVRIVMPVDTSIAGLRRFKQDVSIQVSKGLRNQLERLRGKKMGDVEDGDLGAPASFDFAMVCTLSIPIITIAALVLLLIIVQMLNFVFWWMPFLKICFPLKTSK